MVVYLPGAASERGRLEARERAVLHNAVRKLEALGPDLGYPHSSDVPGADRSRELRPRAGRSAFRALYRQIGGLFVIAAIAPEALHDRKGLDRACHAAETRLGEIEE